MSAVTGAVVLRRATLLSLRGGHPARKLTCKIGDSAVLQRSVHFKINVCRARLVAPQCFKYQFSSG